MEAGGGSAGVGRSGVTGIDGAVGGGGSARLAAGAARGEAAAETSPTAAAAATAQSTDRTLPSDATDAPEGRRAALAIDDAHPPLDGGGGGAVTAAGGDTAATAAARLARAADSMASTATRAALAAAGRCALPVLEAMLLVEAVAAAGRGARYGDAVAVPARVPYGASPSGVMYPSPAVAAAVPRWYPYVPAAAPLGVEVAMVVANGTACHQPPANGIQQTTMACQQPTKGCLLTSDGGGATALPVSSNSTAAAGQRSPTAGQTAFTPCVNSQIQMAQEKRPLVMNYLSPPVWAFC